MKTIGYLIFAGFYYIYRLTFPVKRKKVFSVMTHDASRDGNVGVMMEYLEEQREGYTFQSIRKEDRHLSGNLQAIKGIIAFFLLKTYHLATSEFVLLDNVFLPMAYLRFRKSVKVIQLWHGTGTIKRFGQDYNTGRLKVLEKRSNDRITHLIVNSEETKKQYAGAFGVDVNKVYVYGLPRTDLLFRKDKIEERKNKFYGQYPELIGKKLVLYAPTFRDREKDHPKLELDIDRISKELSPEYVVLLRLHPFVAKAFEQNILLKSYEASASIRSMSLYEDINTLLLVSDYLITDYSSVIYEYCLLEKPMIFYAYDLEQFSDHGRGFYHPYEAYVPGPVVRNTEDIIKLLNKNTFPTEGMIDFVIKNYRYLDGKSAKRIYEHIFCDKE